MMASLYRKIALGYAFLLVLPGLAIAEDANKYMRMELEELLNVTIVTASHSEEKLARAPATMMVINQQQIKERGYLNLLDLLEDLPGVDVNRKNSEESFNQVAIRGNVGNNKFILMQNGIRINSPTGENIPIGYNFPLFQADRVEVLYGGASAIYGADAFTGIINIITKKGGEVDGAKVSSYAGSNNFLYDSLSVGKKVGEKWDVTFGGHWQDSKEPDLSKSYPDRYASTNLLTTSGTVARAASQRESYTAPTGSHSAYAEVSYDDKFTVGMNRSFLSHPSTTANQPKNTIYSDDALWQTLIETYYGKYRYQPTAKLSGESLLTYSSYNVLPDTRFTNNLGGFDAYKYAEGDKLEFQQQLEYQVVENHKMIGGVNLRKYHSIPKTADLSSPYNTNLEPGQQRLFYIGTNNTLPVRLYEIDYESYGAYLNFQSRWNSWFSTSAGFRADYDTRFGETYNPRVGLIFDPTAQTVVKLMYGESFLAPAPYYSYAHFGTFNGTTNASGQYVSNFFQLPTTRLRPEKSRTYEIEIAHHVTPNFVFSGSTYYSQVDDLITSVLRNDTSSFIPGGQILSYQRYHNTGEASIYGMEFKGDYHTTLGPVRLKLWGSYSWVDGTIETDRGSLLQLPLIANHKVKTGATFAWKNYFITPKLNWTSEANTAREYGQNSVPSYALLNLATGVDNIYKNLSLFFNIRNVADNRYFNPSVGLTGQLFPAAPQDPRQFFGGMTYQF